MKENFPHFYHELLTCRGGHQSVVKGNVTLYTYLVLNVICLSSNVLMPLFGIKQAYFSNVGYNVLVVMK